MTLNYHYIVDINNWSGINRLAPQDLIFNGLPYSGLMQKPNQAITKSSDSSSRAPATVVVSNVLLNSGQRFSDAFKTDPIENKVLTIREIEKPITPASVARLVYQGVILYTEHNETECSLVCAEESLALSKRIDTVINTETFPRAKEEDVGQSVGVPFGLKVPETKLPIIEHNKRSTTTVELDETITTAILDRVDNLELGQAFLGEEPIQITLITPGNNSINFTRSEPTEHPSGEIVFMSRQYSLGIDASDFSQTPNPKTTINNIKHVDGDTEIQMPAPNLYGLVGPVRAAIWNTTPILKRNSGSKTSLGIELDTEAGSNSFDPLNAAGRNPAYTEKSFSRITNTNRILRLSNSRYIRPAGKINKVIAQVVHSGNNNANVIGVTPVSIKSKTLGAFATAGVLNAVDQIDKDFMELAEQKGRRAIEVPTGTAPTVQTETVTQLPNFGSRPGGLLRVDPGGTNPVTDANNGNNTDGCLLSAVYPGPTIEGFESQFGSGFVLSGVAPASQLVQLRFRVAHGEQITAPNPPFPGNVAVETTQFTQNGLIEIIDTRTGTTVASATFPSNTQQVIDTATLLVPPPTDTVAELQHYVGRVTLDQAVTFQWIIRECFWEVDYLPASSEEDAGAVINHYDVTGLMPSLEWSELNDFTIELIGDSSIANFKVFQMGITVIYEPQELVLPEDVFADVFPGLQGSVYNIVNNLWTNFALGNNLLTTLSPSAPNNPLGIIAIESFHTNNNYDNAVSGVIREQELFAFLQELARETRLFIYMFNGVLTLQEQDDIANLPLPTKIFTKDDIVGKTGFVGSDIEEQVINKITARYDLTDLRQDRQTIEREDAASVLAYGEQTRKLDFKYLRTKDAAQATISGIFDRKKLPFKQVNFRLTLDDRNEVDPLIRVGLDIDWDTVTLIEIQELTENFDHIINLKARVLIP